MNKKSRKLESTPKLIIYTITLLATLVYIVYRTIFTLPLGLRPIDIVFGLIVFTLELIETFEFIIYYFNTLVFRKKSLKAPVIDDKDYPDVDVFIASINESEELLSNTIKACKAMKYPDTKKVHIYLCDDGERKNIQKLCDKLKINYITRKKHDFAKAGNYNHALKETSSPLITIFDADMQPKPDFLLKTVPFLAQNEKVGFVQTPQSFNNPDIFQARFGAKMPFEQDYFYRYIQLARNHSNSVILCGTNCVISRKALKSVGGFSCATIAEDVATGMLIESKGYRGIAISKTLARGETVDDMAGFLRQRSRWGRGCIQTAKAYGIFRMHGLNLRQKLDYFVAINYWTFGLKRMIYLLLPLLFAFFGIIAIEGDLRVFIPIFFAQYLLKRFAIDLVEKNYRSSTWTKIYELIQAPHLAGAILKELLGFSNKNFKVTTKGKVTKRSWADIRQFAWHMGLLCANGLGIALIFRNIHNIDINIYIIPIVWIIVNTLYLLIAIIFDLRTSRRYESFKPNSAKKYGFMAFWRILWRQKK